MEEGQGGAVRHPKSSPSGLQAHCSGPVGLLQKDRLALETVLEGAGDQGCM